MQQGFCLEYLEVFSVSVEAIAESILLVNE